MDGDLWEKIVLDLRSNAFQFIFDGSIRIEPRDQHHLVELMSEIRLASEHQVSVTVELMGGTA